MITKCDRCNRAKKVRSYPATLKVTDWNGVVIPKRICDRCRSGKPPK